MNKRGEYGDLVKDAVIYIVILALFFAGMMYFVMNQREGAAVWSDIYSKEIVKVINLAEPGDEIRLNVAKATAIASKNDVNFDKIFEFNNAKREICVRLSPGSRSCYGYYNDVVIEEEELELGVPVNILKFKIEGVQNG